MQRHKALNRALAILGALILVLGLVLALNVPQDVKDTAQVFKQKLLSGEWGPGQGGPWGTPFAGPGSRWAFAHHRGFFRAGHLVGFLAAVLIVAAVAGFVVRRARGWHRFRCGQDAVEILREKFASGEIGKDEYLARKRVLESDSGIE